MVGKGLLSVCSFQCNSSCDVPPRFWLSKSSLFYTQCLCPTAGENKEWDAYVHSQAVEWQNTIIGWLIKNKGHPVMLIKFEDLKRNTEIEVMRMLDFLLVPYTEQQVMEVVESGFMEFKRKQRHAPSLEHYTAKQVAHVNEVLRTTVQLLDVRRLSHVCSISDYVAL